MGNSSSGKPPERGVESDTRWMELVPWAVGAFLMVALVVGAYIAVRFVRALRAGNVDMAVWAQFGEFVGGLLNPLIGFVTVTGLVVTLVVQNHTLRLTRRGFDEAARTAAVELANARRASELQADQARMSMQSNKLAALTTLLNLAETELARSQAFNAEAAKQREKWAQRKAGWIEDLDSVYRETLEAELRGLARDFPWM